MPKLTDEQIVRRIAEFMGWREENGLWYSPLSVTPCNRPDWLNSYDAIAEVWQKTDMAQRIIACETKDIENWWDATPHEHAEAIAIAVGEKQEQP